MSDPNEAPEPSENPGEPLDQTTPPMDLQQKSLEPSDVEPLDKTTPKMDSFMGSQNPGRRRA